MEAETSQNLLSAMWRGRKADGMTQCGPKSLETRGASESTPSQIDTLRKNVLPVIWAFLSPVKTAHN